MTRIQRIALIGITLALAIADSTARAEVAVIPRPLEVHEATGTFTLTGGTPIFASPGAIGEARKLAALLAPALGRAPRVIADAPLRLASRSTLAGGTSTPASTSSPIASASRADAIRLGLDHDLGGPGGLGSEGYRLRAAPDGIEIRAAGAAGLFYGIQTLRQLLPPATFAEDQTPSASLDVPAVEILDRPRFAWRGAMLDVARHFRPAEDVKRFLDLLALHKLNRLHWHLSDDQGWRVEIRKYPRLTEIGAWRAESPVPFLREIGLLNALVDLIVPPTFDGTPHGGFYTQAEIRDVVAHARALHIEIVPEIDVPGHSSAAIASYPELGNTGVPIPVATTYGVHENILNVEESTIEFYENVLAELARLFPGRFLHLGGDEVPTKQWAESPAAQARIAELGLASTDDLHGWFISRLARTVKQLGRRPIAWNDVQGDELDSDVAILSWTGQQPGIQAAREGRDVVMAPLDSTYFDHPATISPEAQAALDELTGTPFLTAPFVTPIEQVYAFEPVPPELTPAEARHILGAQAQHWSESILDRDELDSRAFPRLAALAEVVWSAASRRDYGSFRGRFPEHVQRLDALGVRYSRAALP